MSRPEKLGKYQITGVLGTGAMGVVYTGFDPGIRRSVAIKTIHKKLVDDPVQAESMAARFRNEAQAVGRLLHPGIVAIYEYGEDDATSFIAMELVKGQSLAKVIASHQLPETDVLKLMDQLLDALSYAHRNGVLHRDIKPANLILTADGILKVTDFGIARIENIALTQVDLVIGTPGYMAPEQYIGDQIDQRVDVFAAGVLLYKMLTGEAPFTGTYEQVMYKILNEQPVPPSQLANHATRDAYDAVIAKALAKDRNHRYQSAGELRAALSSIARAIGLDGTDTTVVVRQDPSAAKPPNEPSNAASNSVAGRSGSQPGPTSGASLPGTARTGGPTTGGTALTPITGWDAQVLTQVERTLATYIGPMARVLVRQSARRAVDLGSLSALLAEHIEKPQDRKAFTTRLETLTPSGSTKANPATATATASAASAGGTGPGTGSPLTDATLDHALKTLARHIGPIAKVVVRKAQGQAASREQFIQILAEQSPAGTDRAKLVAELQRGP